MRKFLLVVGLFLAVAGCGGGGGGGASNQPVTPVASPNTFNFQSGWQKFLASNQSRSLNVTGSCSGTLQYAHGALSSPRSFDYSDTSFPHPSGTVNPGYVVSHTQTLKSSLPGCVTFSSETTTTAYYDATTNAPYGYVGATLYNGATSARGTFREFSTKVVLPLRVQVGDAGSIGSENIYGISNFRKDGISQGRIDVTYSVEANSLTTAIVNVISKMYDAQNSLTLVDQSRYLIDQNDNVSLYSIDQEYFDSSKLRLQAK